MAVGLHLSVECCSIHLHTVQYKLIFTYTQYHMISGLMVQIRDMVAAGYGLTLRYELILDKMWLNFDIHNKFAHFLQIV